MTYKVFSRVEGVCRKSDLFCSVSCTLQPKSEANHGGHLGPHAFLLPLPPTMWFAKLQADSTPFCLNSTEEEATVLGRSNGLVEAWGRGSHLPTGSRDIRNQASKGFFFFLVASHYGWL